MNLLLKIIIIVLFLVQFVWGYFFFKKIFPGEVAKLKRNISKPYAVLTIDYGEPVKGFSENSFYVLKALKIRGTKVDYGFCEIQRNEQYVK